MIHRIQEVTAKDNFVLEALFFSGELVRYDVKRLFNFFPQFQRLIDETMLFNKVSVEMGGYGIVWDDELDLDAETIWEEGILIETKKTDINHILAYQLLQARKNKNITQMELANITGVHQADISKIERGVGNPSLATLKRLAEGLNMELKVDFIVK